MTQETNRTFPTPYRGDILFIRGPAWITKLSGTGQKLIDRQAIGATKFFGHVAVVIDRWTVLEAMPEPRRKRDKVGAWSGIELQGGVRLRPLPDVLIGARKGRRRLSVLRSPEMSPDAVSALDVTTPALSSLIGSAYDLGSLQVVGAHLSRVKHFRAPARDIATKMGLDAPFRSRLAKELPDYRIPEESVSLYCSQLAARLLRHAGLMPGDQPTDTITPTGLFSVLTELGWIDVTETDYSQKRIDNLLRGSRSACRAQFTSNQAQLALSQQALALGEATNAIQAVLKRAESYLDSVVNQLDQHRE